DLPKQPIGSINSVQYPLDIADVDSNGTGGIRDELLIAYHSLFHNIKGHASQLPVAVQHRRTRASASDAHVGEKINGNVLEPGRQIRAEPTGCESFLPI